MSEALARIEDVRNDMTLSQVGKLFAQSGFFSDAKQEAQAITKIMAGRENGFGPFSSMSGIHIIKGKMEMGADLLATAIKRSGKYNYKVITMTPEECTVEFFEKSEFTGGKWDKVGVSSFTIEDAQKAGLTSNDTYKKFARNMLFARAMSNGQAWFCPDVFQSRVYSEGEVSGYSEPQKVEAEVVIDEHQLEKAYAAIEAITDDEHPAHSVNSCQKHLGVDTVRECRDIEKLRKYYAHKKKQADEKAKKEAESAIPEKELAGMRGTITAYRSDLLEVFDESAIAKDWEYCQSIFDEALKHAPVEQADVVEAFDGEVEA